MRESNSLISIEVGPEIFGPKNDTVTVPLHTVFYPDNFKLLIPWNYIYLYHGIHDKRTTTYYFIHSIAKGLQISCVLGESYPCQDAVQK